jgi:hypothetical protein
MCGHGEKIAGAFYAMQTRCQRDWEIIPNSQRQSVQWVGRRCCAAGYVGRAATRPYRLEWVPIIIGKWYQPPGIEKLISRQPQC